MPKFEYTTEIREKMRQAKLKNPTKYWKGKKFSDEYKKKLSEAHKGQIPWHAGKHRKDMNGKNHWNWKGGITSMNIKLRRSLEYKLWRESVFKRDNYTCIWCGVRNGNGKKIVLNADHIKPWCDYPELRFSIDNGRTLCRECHFKTYKKHETK